MQMFFEELYLFSPHERLARRFGFAPGINVVTSSKENGTRRGKSVLLHSLYYALGGETRFDDKFDIRKKVIVLRFRVDQTSYYILRVDRMVKLFDVNRRFLWMSIASRDLAEKLGNLFRFNVRLRDRKNKKFEIAPPAYNYLPYFLDQDHYVGSKFESFDKLGQYADFKKDALNCHFGVFTEEWFRLQEEKEQLELMRKEQDARGDILDALISDLLKKLGTKPCSLDEDSLRADIERYQREYSPLMNEMNKLKAELIKLRNAKLDFETLQQNLGNCFAANEAQIKKLNSHRCPECNSPLIDTVPMRGRRYNLGENILLLNGSIQAEMARIEQEIQDKTGAYSILIRKVAEYDKRLSLKSGMVKDILKYRGLTEVYNDSVLELHAVNRQRDSISSQLETLTKRLSTFKARERQINESYCELVTRGSFRFELEEFDSKKFRTLDLNFNATGSDKYIVTVLWYLTIVALRNKFNPDAIKFPIVFDSPNNVENDDNKTEELIDYLIENAGLSGQFVMSGIGFDNDQFKSKVSMNRIVLTTPKFHLLQADAYAEFAPLLEELMGQQS